MPADRRFGHKASIQGFLRDRAAADRRRSELVAELRRRNGHGSSAASETPEMPPRNRSPVIEMATPTESNSPASGREENNGSGHAFHVPHLEILENLALVVHGAIAPLPFVLRALVATATNPWLDHPVCIILPDVEGIAEIVAAISALVKLRADWPGLEEAFVKDLMHSGAQLRSVAEGKIIQFNGFGHSHGQDWVYLHYVDAQGQRTHGRLTLPRKVIFGLEPTERKRPFFKSGEKPGNPVATSFDRAAGTRTCGNTKLILIVTPGHALPRQRVGQYWAEKERRPCLIAWSTKTYFGSV
jgi:hypothetical protein